MASIGATLLGGVLYALAFEPYGWAMLGWVAIVPLLVIIRGRSPASGFLHGVVYGCAFGWLVTGWSAPAVVRYFGLSWPLAIAGLSGFFALVSAPSFGLFGAGAAFLLRERSHLTARFAIPALWVAAELVRGRLVGQPWGLLGYTQYRNTGLIQIAALTGVYGVSYLLALGNVVLANAIAEVRARRSIGAVLPSLVLAAVAVALFWTVGTLVAVGGPTGGYGGRTIAIVQTNVPPAFEWTRAYANRQLKAHVIATEQLADESHPALVVWPENAVTEYVETDPALARLLGQLAARRRADLLFGTPRWEDGRTFNSVRLITEDGRSGGYYDKQLLVLLAERALLGPPTPAEPSDSPRSFTAGAKTGVLRSFVPIGVSICHEIIYPELVRQAVRAGAALLVNVSNDGWLDAGSGAASRQHFAMAVFRAVETRRYLVRAATTGISGVVDPFGRVGPSLAPDTAGVLVAQVAGRSVLTPYVQVGDTFAFGCAVIAAFAFAGGAPALSTRRRTLAPAPSTS